MNILNHIARYIFAIPFFIFGINNLVYIDNATKSVPQYMPNPEIWAYIVAISLILAAIMIALNKLTATVGISLSVLLFCLAFMVHFPKLMHPETVQLGMVGFLKDFALAGAAFFIGLNSKSNKK